MAVRIDKVDALIRSISARFVSRTLVLRIGIVVTHYRLSLGICMYNVHIMRGKGSAYYRITTLIKLNYMLMMLMAVVTTTTTATR